MKRPKMSVERVVEQVKQAADTVNPPRDERTGYRRVTCTMTADMLADLKQEGARRLRAGEPHHETSEIIREAVTAFLMR